jgi:hypothetical protein
VSATGANRVYGKPVVAVSTSGSRPTRLKSDVHALTPGSVVRPAGWPSTTAMGQRRKPDQDERPLWAHQSCSLHHRGASGARTARPSSPTRDAGATGGPCGMQAALIFSIGELVRPVRRQVQDQKLDLPPLLGGAIPLALAFAVSQHAAAIRAKPPLPIRVGYHRPTPLARRILPLPLAGDVAHHAAERLRVQKFLHAQSLPSINDSAQSCLK